MNDKDAAEQFVKDYAARRRLSFQSPDYDAFRTQRGLMLPESIYKIYELRENLLLTPLSVIVGEQILDIQYFLPLNAEAVRFSEVLQYTHIRFAIGINGEGILAPLNKCGCISISHDDLGTDCEETTIDVASVADWLSAYFGKRNL